MTLVVPGSHLWTIEQRATWQQWLRPEDVVQIRVPPGSVMLWRNQILHAVAPNVSDQTRLHLYFSYQPRWMRQTNVMDMHATYPELLERCSPIRRQLLGAMGDNSSPMPSPGVANHWACSWDQLPLREWAEAHARPGEPMDWGLGKGAPFNIFVRLSSVPPQAPRFSPCLLPLPVCGHTGDTTYQKASLTLEIGDRDPAARWRASWASVRRRCASWWSPTSCPLVRSTTATICASQTHSRAQHSGCPTLHPFTALIIDRRFGLVRRSNHLMRPEWRTEADGHQPYAPIGLLGAVDTRASATATQASIEVVRSVLPELSPDEARSALGAHRGDVRGALRELLAKL